jgi:hypothetical protein
MQDAHYLRSQAELCLHMAAAVSDVKVAVCLRAAAADYFLRAVDAECPIGPGPDSANSTRRQP